MLPKIEDGGQENWMDVVKRYKLQLWDKLNINLYAEYIIRNVGWRKHKLKSRLLGEISITSDMQMTPVLWQKVKRN